MAFTSPFGNIAELNFNPNSSQLPQNQKAKPLAQPSQNQSQKPKPMAMPGASSTCSAILACFTPLLR